MQPLPPAFADCQKSQIALASTWSSAKIDPFVRCRLVAAGLEECSGSIRQSGWEDSKHGCLHEFLVAAHRYLSPSASCQETERLAQAHARRSKGVAPLLASDPESGHPGTSRPLSAIGPGLLLDPAEPSVDDVHP